MLIQQNVSLKQYSNFKIGGNARYFLEIKNNEELIAGLKEWKQIARDLDIEGQRIFVLGGGTNILFAATGFSGLVIKNSIKFLKLENNTVDVGAGTPWAEFASFCIDNSLSGIEWSGGLPGTVGGAIRGNAGAYNGETKDLLVEVKSINFATQELITRNNQECNFSYRNSIYKTGEGEEEIIVSAKFKLNSGEQNLIKAATEERIEARQKRHPLEYPNVGSIFKNVAVDRFETKQYLYELVQYVKNDPFPVVPTAKLNFLAGLKGKKVGDAQLSEKHTNFIINLGNASAEDVKSLITIIKQTVKEKYKVELEPEIMFVD